MRAKLAIIAFICLLITGLAIYDTTLTPMPSNTANAKRMTAAKEQLPSACFPLLNKQKVLCLDEFSDSTLLLNFWASWCAPCIEEFPRLLGLAAENSEAMQMVFISNDQTPEAAQEFLIRFESLPKNVTMLWDEEGLSQSTFQTYKFPESLLVSADGSIVKKYVGAVKEDDIEEIERKLQSE
jgi:thiol-disulfide isomerase/thioredoxin